MIGLTDLMEEHIKTTLVMAAAGVFTESLRLLKNTAGKNKKRWVRAVYDAAFWISAAFVISMFLYYCSYGRVTFHGAAGFLAGLLLWKKICCDIISAWVGTDEAQNTRTTAVSSTWRKPDVSDWKKEGRSKRKKKKRRSARREEIRGENGP